MYKRTEKGILRQCFMVSMLIFALASSLVVGVPVRYSSFASLAFVGGARCPKPILGKKEN